MRFWAELIALGCEGEISQRENGFRSRSVGGGGQFRTATIAFREKQPGMHPSASRLGISWARIILEDTKIKPGSMSTGIRRPAPVQSAKQKLDAGSRAN